jgi:hypothetical protein
MFSGLASGAKELGFRFTVSGLLPFVLLAAFTFALATVAAAPDGTGPFKAVTDEAVAVGPAGAAVALVAAFVAAVITQPFQVAMVRLLEGYWGVSRPASWARGVGVEIQRRRVHRLALQQRLAEAADDEHEAAHHAERRARFPAESELLPTSLGNALRAGERRAGERYGLDTVATWSRLYYVLPEPLQRDVGELHGQVDGSARLTLALGLSATVGCPVLLSHGWWNLVWTACAVLSVVAYRGGVTAATQLAGVLAAAFDLHRFDLLRQLHLPLPKRADSEQTANSGLTAFLLGDASGPLALGDRYSHP